MEEQVRGQLTVAKEKAVLVGCLLPGNQNDPHDPLGELQSLADTAGAITVDHLLQNRQKPDPASFIGSGKLVELAEMVRFHEADVVIFDNDLSPSQLANVEKSVEVKVLDRSELILDIFAARARTHEAKLQVELAQLEYTYPRLRAMWSHLERIAGGAPAGIGTRGPGEQQLEIDRRIVQRRKAELKRDISRVQSRKAREVEKRNQDFFTVGLVGYTNAGKSTLFNAVTTPSGGGGAYADDKLFATLSTRTRQWKLGQSLEDGNDDPRGKEHAGANTGGGNSVMLSDTVGFVRDLPHHLVASFKATLEEAVHADLLLIVLDIAHPRALHQLEVVMEVLDDIGATGAKRQLVLNKADVLDTNADVLVVQKSFPDALLISAKTGGGLDELTDRVTEIMSGGTRHLKLAVAMSAGKAIHFIENRAEVIDRQYDAEDVVYETRIGRRQLDQLKAMGTPMRIVADLPD